MAIQIHSSNKRVSVHFFPLSRPCPM